MAYVNKDLQDKSYPLLTDVVKYTKKADNEKLESRDVRPLMFALNKLPRLNPLVGGHIQTRRTAVSAFGMTMSAIEKSDQQKAKEAFNRTRVLLNKMLDYQVQTPLYGVFAAKILWQDAKFGMTPFVEKKYKPFELERADDPRLIQLLDDSGRVKRTSIEGDPEEMWLTAVDSSDDCGGIMRSLLVTEILRDQAIKDWHRFNKKLKGIVLGKYGIDDEDEKKIVMQAVQSIGADVGAVTSKESEITFEKLVDAIGKDSYKDFVAIMEMYSAVAITGHAHTSQLGSTGSQAALNVYQLVRQDVYYSDIKNAQELADKIILDDYRMLTTNKEETEAPWRVEINTPEEEDRESNARIAETLLNAGVKIAATDLYKKTGFRQPEQGEEVFEKKAVAGLGGGI